MPLRTLILNILTFGYYGLKELSKLRNAELEKAREIADSATELHIKMQKTPARMVHIQAYDPNSEEYLRKITEFAKDPAVVFFMFNIQQDIYGMLNQATDDKAVEIMGMSKGFKYLLQGLDSAVREYKEISTAKKPVNESDGVYV